MKQSALLTVPAYAKKMRPKQLPPENLQPEKLRPEKLRSEKLGSEQPGIISAPSVVAEPSFSPRDRNPPSRPRQA